jgi:hypothetical protein
MSTDQNTPPENKSRKPFVAAMLFLILVVLPAGSWYYLRSGLNWRKTAQAELRDFGKRGNAWLIYPGSDKRTDDLAGKVCYIHYFGENPDLTAENRKILDDCERIYAQFKESNNVRCVQAYRGGTAEFLSHAQKLPTFDYWTRAGDLIQWSKQLETGYQMFLQSEGSTTAVPQYYAVTDTSGTIRRYYNAMDDKQISRMIEHIALLLPKE